MVQFTFDKLFFLLTSIHFLVKYTNGEHSNSVSIDISNEFLPAPLNAFAKDNNWNESESRDNLTKSRRKRYVAFPEGSSLSVKFIKIVHRQVKWRPLIREYIEN